MRRSGLTAEEVKDFFTIRGRENPYEEKVPLKLYTFRPKAGLGGGPGGLTFDPVEMKAMVQKGEASASEFIASLDPAEITWA